MSSQALLARTAPPLRVAQREVTRRRICDAARELFLRDGYHAARLDEIAQRAALSRSTLYQHFGDKNAILAELAGSYRAGLVELVEHLPPGSASRAAIGAWIERLARFVAAEQVPTILIVELANGEDAPAAIRGIGDALTAALAARSPAFARTRGDDEDAALARAWAQVVLREIGWACLRHARSEGEASAAALQVAADLLWQFINQGFRRSDQDDR